ncbi:MAG: sortase [Ilumatobacteraceae bacterium]
MPDIESPAFALRLGRLLRTQRQRRHQSRRSLVAESDGSFSAPELRHLERGSVQLDESLIDAACRMYGADLGAILPSRFPVSIEGGVISTGGVRHGFSPGDTTSLLRAYLRLIRSLRHQNKAPAIALRRNDIDELARHLGVSGEEVVDRLTALMGATAAQRSAMTSMFAAGAIVIGLAVFAGSGIDVAHAAPAAVSAPSSIEVGEAPASLESQVLQSGSVVVEVAAPPASINQITTTTDLAGLARAARLDTPAATTAGPPAAPVEPVAVQTVNRSGCRTGPGSALTLVIPEISYVCPVYAGGQSTIDAGYVTLITVPGAESILTTNPGGPGTLWLAGHRTAHGAAFADVPLLSDGATITVADGTHTATYRVVGRAYVEVRNGLVVDANGNATQAATLAAIVGAGRTSDVAPRLVLQTCDGLNFRWMIYAELVTT